MQAVTSHAPSRADSGIEGDDGKIVTRQFAEANQSPRAPLPEINVDRAPHGYFPVNIIPPNYCLFQSLRVRGTRSRI